MVQGSIPSRGASFRMNTALHLKKEGSGFESRAIKLIAGEIGKHILLGCHPVIFGPLSEKSGSGLQNHLDRCDTCTDLQENLDCLYSNFGV